VLQSAPSDRAAPVFFAGRLYDPQTGLVDMRARVYDPRLGRFLTPDPAGLQGGVNAYAYVRGRPTDRIDPLGLWDWVPDWARSAGSSVASAARTGASAVADLGQAMGLLLGVSGDPEMRADFRRYMWEDIASGGAQSRALGAIDGYTNFVSFGLVDPNTRRWAYDPAQAAVGQSYGEGAGWVFAVASLRPTQLLKSGARTAAAAPGALVRGVRALPGAPRAIWNGARAAVASLPGLIRGTAGNPSALARFWEGARGLPGRAADAGRWLVQNRGAIGRSAADFLAAQANHAWNVTGRPFVNLTRALAGRSRQAANALTRLGNGGRATGAGTAAAETVNGGRGAAAIAAAPESVGVVGALEGRTMDSTRRIYQTTNDVGEVWSSGRVWGQTEGSAYGMAVENASRWRTMVNPRNRDAGNIVFEGPAAQLFELHPYEGFYSGVKRALGQHRTGFGDIVFDRATASFVGDTIVIRDAALAGHAGQSTFSAASRMFTRQVMDGALTLGIYDHLNDGGP
jgi:RHS repeat-associated protein